MTQDTLQDLLVARYADAPLADGSMPERDAVLGMAARGSCRAFKDKPVPDDWLNMLCAVALAAPSKSDLQQRDIIVLKSAEQRAGLAQLVAGQGWIAAAPMIAVFCGNNRRQRLLHAWHDVPFANDQLDAFFNATGDAAIALGAFVMAAEAVGLGCCPISAVRNEAAAVSDLLGLPDHVFPFAGLAIGFPDKPTEVSPRLPLSVTCHTDRYSEEGLREAVESYDQKRRAVQPYTKQRRVDVFGQSETYGWSEDKVRQYSMPERADFGDYVRARKFKLE